MQMIEGKVLSINNGINDFHACRENRICHRTAQYVPSILISVPGDVWAIGHRHHRREKELMGIYVFGNCGESQ